MPEVPAPLSDPVLRQLVETLREPVAIGNGVMERVLAEAAGDLRRRRHRMTLLWAGALAASLVLAIAGTRWVHRSDRPAPGVTFALSAPDAGRVALIGDFNNWDPSANPLRRSDTAWAVTLRLKPGRYRYSFVIDGASWRADPRTPQAEDEFGAPTSVITVAN